MKFDLTKEVLNLRGKIIPFKDEDNKEVNMTYQHVLQVLTTADLKDEQENFEAKNKKFKLGLKVYGHGQVELTNEDCVWLKERCAKIFPTVVTGRLAEFLESPEVGESK